MYRTVEQTLAQISVRSQVQALHVCRGCGLSLAGCARLDGWPATPDPGLDRLGTRARSLLSATLTAFCHALHGHANVAPLFAAVIARQLDTKLGAVRAAVAEAKADVEVPDEDGDDIPILRRMTLSHNAHNLKSFSGFGLAGGRGSITK